jgi:hypothetical protein
MNASGITSLEFAVLKPQLEYYKYMQSGALQKQAEYSKALNDLTKDTEIFKSDLSAVFNDFVDIFKEFLNTLTYEQLVIIFNLSGYMMLISILTSITLILVGNNLIDYFKLESKYPKLTAFISLKIKGRKYQLNFYIVQLYFVLLILISLNIFMFSYDYFYF